MGEWTDVTLGDVLTLQRGFDITKKELREGSVPVVSSSGIAYHHDEAKVPGPGVVVGRKGSLGTVYFLEGPFWPHDTTLWVKDFKGNDPYFCYLLLKTLRLEELDVGAANPTLNRNHAHQLRVKRPDLESQQRIDAVISVFDRLIRVNEQRIQILEDLALSLYREYFVHFRFEGHAEMNLVDSAVGPIPAGWDVKGLYDVADVGFGFPFKSSGFTEAGSNPVVRIRDVPKGTTDTFTDEEPDVRYRVTDGDILVGMDGNFHVRRWSGGVAWLNQRVARLRPRGDLDALHLMLAVTEPIRQLNGSIVGTTVAHLGKRHLEEIRFAMPPPQLLTAVGGQLDALGNLQLDCEKQMRSLAAIRDLLLPRLVTGQLDISDIDLGVLAPPDPA